MKFWFVVTWVLFYAVGTLILLSPFAAIGFIFGFCKWGFEVGISGANRALNKMPEHIHKRRDQLMGKS